MHAVPLGVCAEDVAFAQIVSVGIGSKRIAVAYGVSGVQVPVLTRHHKIDAPEVGSVMVVRVGIAYVPEPSVMDGVAVCGSALV